MYLKQIYNRYMKQNNEKQEKSVSIRFPILLLETLREIAKEDNRSLNGEVITILQDYISDRKRKRKEGKKDGHEDA